MGSIRLHGIRLQTIVGDLPHEREIPQPIEIDVDVETDFTAAVAGDDLGAALDYRDIYAAVGDVLETDRGVAPRLLETLCDRIAIRVLEIGRVERVVVRCRKPWAAIGGLIDGVEVEVTRP